MSTKSIETLIVRGNLTVVMHGTFTAQSEGERLLLDPDHRRSAEGSGAHEGEVR